MLYFGIRLGEDNLRQLFRTAQFRFFADKLYNLSPDFQDLINFIERQVRCMLLAERKLINWLQMLILQHAYQRLPS
jgi:hypothetical protein